LDYSSKPFAANDPLTSSGTKGTARPNEVANLETYGKSAQPLLI